MFGMGFMEILLVLVIAIVALGPEKLPSALVDMAKMIKKFKSGLDDAKSTLDNELQISELKQHAEEFTATISDVKEMANIDLDDLETSSKPKKKVKDEDSKPKIAKAKKEKIPLANEEV